MQMHSKMSIANSGLATKKPFEMTFFPLAWPRIKKIGLASHFTATVIIIIIRIPTEMIQICRIRINDYIV